MKRLVSILALVLVFTAQGAAMSSQTAYNMVRSGIALVRLNEAEHKNMGEALSVLKKLVIQDAKNKKKKKKKK